MNPFFAELIRAIQRNGGGVIILMFAFVVGAFIFGQAIAQKTTAYENEHEQMRAEISKNTQDIASVNARFETFRDEIRLKMEEMNSKLTRLLTLAEKNERP